MLLWFELYLFCTWTLLASRNYTAGAQRCYGMVKFKWELTQAWTQKAWRRQNSVISKDTSSTSGLWVGMGGFWDKGKGEVEMWSLFSRHVCVLTSCRFTTLVSEDKEMNNARCNRTYGCQHHKQKHRALQAIWAWKGKQGAPLWGSVFTKSPQATRLGRQKALRVGLYVSGFIEATLKPLPTRTHCLHLAMTKWPPYWIPI